MIKVLLSFLNSGWFLKDENWGSGTQRIADFRGIARIGLKHIYISNRSIDSNNRSDIIQIHSIQIYTNIYNYTVYIYIYISFIFISLGRGLPCHVLPRVDMTFPQEKQLKLKVIMLQRGDTAEDVMLAEARDGQCQGIPGGCE